jgi:hypothetical protein
MPKKVRNGWVAPLPTSLDFRMERQSKSGARRGGAFDNPSGIYIHGGQSVGVWLTFAGMDRPPDLQLPNDSNILRDVAAAIRAFADDPEHFPAG